MEIGQYFKSGQKYIIAVSGGVDSVVLLDLMLKIKDIEIVIAHFDHQIRGEASRLDAEFVRNLAYQHRLKYEIMTGNLGQKCSEELARKARYQFLRSVTDKYQAQLVVAHHFDDVLESIAINLSRGTGWLGLAVMSSNDILRPMLSFNKQQILDYAKLHQLQWREDESNQSDRYLRNRLRPKINNLPNWQKGILNDLFWRQKALRTAIDAEVEKIYQKNNMYQRYFWIMLDLDLAAKIFKILLLSKYQIPITLNQAKNIVIAIKTTKPNTIFEINKNCVLKIEINMFEIKYI